MHTLPLSESITEINCNVCFLVLKPRSGSFFSQDDKKKDGKRKRKKKSKKTIKEGTECDKDIYMSIHDDGLVVDDDYNENLDDEQDQNGEVEAQKHSKILGRSCSPRTSKQNVTTFMYFSFHCIMQLILKLMCSNISFF